MKTINEEDIYKLNLTTLNLLLDRYKDLLYSAELLSEEVVDRYSCWRKYGRRN